MVTLVRAACGDLAAPEPGRHLPRRVRLSRAAFERLAARTGTPLPWTPGRPTGPTAAAPPRGSDPEPRAADAELRRRGLLVDEAPADEVSAALAVLARPEVAVDLDVAVRRGSARAHLRSWHRLNGGRVTTLSGLSGAEAELELGWFDDRLWQSDLARLADVGPARPEPASPLGHLTLPHELLLGAGEALRAGREEVLAELLGRHGALVGFRDGRSATSSTTEGDSPRATSPTTEGDGRCAAHPTSAAEQVRLLHGASLGRLRAVVAGVRPGDGRRGLGVVSWLRYADGWRRLSPYTHERVAMVRVERVDAGRLGADIARLVTGVRS